MHSLHFHSMPLVYKSLLLQDLNPDVPRFGLEKMKSKACNLQPENCCIFRRLCQKRLHSTLLGHLETWGPDVNIACASMDMHIRAHMRPAKGPPSFGVTQSSSYQQLPTLQPAANVSTDSDQVGAVRSSGTQTGADRTHHRGFLRTAWGRKELKISSDHLFTLCSWH